MPAQMNKQLVHSSDLKFHELISLIPPQPLNEVLLFTECQLPFIGDSVGKERHSGQGRAVEERRDTGRRLSDS